MAITKICSPGLIICQLFPRARDEKGITVSAVRFAAESDYYGAVEFAEVLNKNERREIAKIVDATELKVVYWLSIMQYEMTASVSALDEDERRDAVQQILSQIPYAAECKADYVGFLSGPDVAADKREKAKNQLCKSICEIAEESDKYGLTQFVLESMDREAHKRKLLGPTPETVEFISAVRKTVPNLYLGFDTSHIKLLGEEPLESLALARDVTSQIHFANCITDPANPEFGDNHMPLGEPGFLTFRYIVKMFRKAMELGFLGDSRPIVSAEVAAMGGHDSWEKERQAREIMLRAWQLASESVQ